MIGPAVIAIKAYLQAQGIPSWPTRWENDRWSDGVLLDINDNPHDATGTILPFVEIEVQGGENRLRGFSTPTNRLFEHLGLLRFYLCVPSNSGMTAALTLSDTLSQALTRKEITISATQMVRMHDFRSWDRVAEMAVGNYFVPQCSISFEFLYEG